jgi:hypothetical protein
VRLYCDRCQGPQALAAFCVEGERLLARCAGCGAQAQVERAPAEPGALPPPPRLPELPPPPQAKVLPLHPVRSPADPLAVPFGHCPKCITPAPPDALACVQCGLVFANALEAEYGPSTELAEQWRLAQAQWLEAGVHEQLLSFAQVRGELAELGRLYRIRGVLAPGDLLAHRGREEVLRRALSHPCFAGPLPTGRSRQVRAVATALLLGFAALALGGLVWLGVRG